MSNVVLTDIEMPGIDGFHLCKLIKDDPELKSIPVVLFSSLITEKLLHKGAAVGADGQFSKPDSDGLMRFVAGSGGGEERPARSALPSSEMKRPKMLVFISLETCSVQTPMVFLLGSEKGLQASLRALYRTPTRPLFLLAWRGFFWGCFPEAFFPFRALLMARGGGGISLLSWQE